MNQLMTRVDIRASAALQASVLLVMLPGAYDAPKDFIEQGFIKAAHDQGLHTDVDITLLDAHIGYYTNQQIVQRLRDEVVLPAKAQGYTQVWLVGISLGGYGSLLYSMREGGVQASGAAQAQGQEQGQRQSLSGVDGIFIMAPFMGSRHLPAEVAKAGGLLAWQPAPPDPSASTQAKPDIDDELWAWLKRYVSQAHKVRQPPIYLGYGVEDRFVASNRLLAAQLPAPQVMTVAGGHTWGPWLALWQQFLLAKPWVHGIKP